MKKHLFLLIAGLLFLVGCSEDSGSGGSSTSSDSLRNDYEVSPSVELIEDKAPFYIISVGGHESAVDAASEVLELRKQHENAGYLWIPDYESLSGKEMYSTFIGPFNYMEDCMPALVDYKRKHPGAYGLKVAHQQERYEFHSFYDIRRNGKKQKLILIYSTPEDEEAYAEDGGEDWGWFVNDVSEYFSGAYPDEIVMSSVYGGWLTEEEIGKLESELKPEGFGYILVDGNRKYFTPHDLPDGVISSACEFFELECNR